MKKTLKLISILLVLAIALCACGKKEEVFSYSSIYDDNGFFKNIKISDYVTIPEVSELAVK